MAPLLSGERTRYAHPGCYAHASQDCSEKLSNEHWLSADVLRSAGGGKPVLVSGMPWQGGSEHRLAAPSLGSNILCDRHNGALSPLDLAAGQVFRVVNDFQADLRQKRDPHGHEFALFDGDALERWMLKLYWGGVVARSFGHNGVPVTNLRSSIVPAALAEVLFRGQPMPSGWGLYMGGRSGEPFSGEAAVAIESLSGPDGGLWGGVVEFAAVAFRLYLGTPSANDPAVGLHRHPQGVIISPLDRSVQKVLALGWVDGTSPLIMTRMADGATERKPSAL